MSGFVLPEINPLLYVFIFVQTFLYVPFMAVLAVLRAGSAQARARLWGLAAMATALAALGLQFGPAVLGLYDGAFPQIAGQATRALQGMALPLVASVPLAISAFAEGRRYWGIDLVHALGAIGFLGLFAYTRVV